MEVSVHRLRKQLDEIGAGVAVHTVRGVGYLIREDASSEGAFHPEPDHCASFGCFFGISVAIIAAAFLLLNATVDKFEESVLRTHAQTISRYLSYRDGGWKLSLPPALAPDYRSGSGRFRAGRYQQ